MVKVEANIIAKRGWTTTDLLKATEYLAGESSYDFATLLIGVNNHYDGIPFGVFAKEFVALIDIALAMIKV